MSELLLAAGFLVRADVQVTDRLRFFQGYANAPDASDGHVFRTESFFGGAELALDDRTSVRASGSHHRTEGSYQRTSVDLGLTYRF
jgi:hypothetical protein